MKMRVFDTTALLAFLTGDAGADRVELALATAEEKHQTVAVSAVTWSELLAEVLTTQGEKALGAVRQFAAMVCLEVVPVDTSQAEAAAKLMLSGVSFPAAFAAGLAQLKKAELVTCSPEFDKLDGIKLNRAK